MTKIDEKFLSNISDSPGRCAFRGQENAAWELHSSAIRRLQNDSKFQESITTPGFPGIFLNYHRDELIAPAHASGFGIEQGRKIWDLQLLAKLQHFGAATGLMDFTWNPLIALWFACKSAKNAKGPGGEESDGKVFVVNLNDPQGFGQIPHKKKDQSIERVLRVHAEDRALYWEPMILSEAAARIIGQESVFVIGQPFIPERLVQEITINAQDKASFRKELADIFGITEESLYRDVHGFSKVNGVDSTIRLMSKDLKNHLHQGNALYQSGEYSEAIRSYTRSIALLPDVRELYFLRANAKSDSGDYSGALSDYDKAKKCGRLYIEDSEGNSQRDRRQMLMLLFNRGNSRAALNDHVGAIADFDDAIQYCPTEFWTIRVMFNRGNSKAMLQRLKEALADYDHILKHGTNEPGVPYEKARYNKGNMLLMLGRPEEAMECYEQASGAHFGDPNASRNLEAVIRAISYISGGHKERVVTEPARSERLPVRNVEVIYSNLERSSAPIPFAGNVGNIGNTGGFSLLGGPGFGGGPGFAVQISKDSQ